MTIAAKPTSVPAYVLVPLGYCPSGVLLVKANASRNPRERWLPPEAASLNRNRTLSRKRDAAANKSISQLNAISSIPCYSRARWLSTQQTSFRPSK